MTQQPALLVDCHKIINWLQQRRKLPKQWYNYQKAASQKIKFLLKDPQQYSDTDTQNIVQYIKENTQNFTYMNVVQIFNMLLKTKWAQQKNLLFGYSDPRVKQWQNIKKFMENKQVAIVNIAKYISQGLSFELPSMDKNIELLDSQIANLKRKIDFNTNTVYHQQKQSNAQKVKLGLKSINDKGESITVTEQIPRLIIQVPELINKLQDKIYELRNFYTLYLKFCEKDGIDVGDGSGMELRILRKFIFSGCGQPRYLASKIAKQVIGQQTKIYLLLSMEASQLVSLSEKGQKYRERQEQNNQMGKSEYKVKLSSIKLPNSVIEILRSGKTLGRRVNKSEITESIFAKYREISNKFVCQICASEFQDKQKGRIGKCQHYFCDLCLRHYLDYKIARYEEVSCPAQKCQEIMDQQGDFYKSLSQLQKQKYIKLHTFYSVMKRNNENNNYKARLCPDQHCVGVIQIRENQPLNCDKCQKVYCPKCFFPEHQGKCQKNEVEFYHNNLHFRQCNSCKNIVQKTEGCNHIRCTCGYEFCYLCGKRWNNNHSCRALIPTIPLCYSCFQEMHQLGGNNNFGKFVRLLIKIFVSTPIFVLYLLFNIIKLVIAAAILFVVTIFLGCTVYAVVFACQCGCCCGCLLLLLYPISLVGGIGLSFCEFSIGLFANIWNAFLDESREGFEGLYKWDS